MKRPPRYRAAPPMMLAGMASTNTAVRLLKSLVSQADSSEPPMAPIRKMYSVINASPMPRSRYGTMLWIRGMTMLNAATASRLWTTPTAAKA